MINRLQTCFLFSLLLCTFYAKAQIINGSVYSDSTKTAIIGATVYYGGSTSGTITNQEGHFELQAKAQQIPVAVSCIGYYSATAYYKPGQPFIIYLKPKQERLRVVTIRVDGMDRKDEIALFKREFLGVSSYALSCTIENIDDIDFFYSKKTQTLTASCDKPLIIDNKKLGYTITYYLDQFKRTPREVYFAGNYIFKEEKWLTAAQQAKIKNSREDAYAGSRMQLIRALWHHRLEKTDFNIYTTFYGRLNEDSIVVRDSLGQKYLKLDAPVIITNSRYVRNTTRLEGRKRTSFIDKEGFYSLGLRWSGRLAVQRVGDLLPFEYQSEKELNRMNLPDVAPANGTPMVRKLAEGNIAGNNEAWQKFRSIVLMPGLGLDTTPIVEKWQQAIHYKTYSSLGETAANKTFTSYIQQTFKQLEPLTACPTINETADSLVNFYIIIGKPAAFSNILPSDINQYFKAQKTNTCYYTVTENGFKRMVIYVDPGNVKKPDTQQLQELWCRIRLLMMKGLGFPGTNSDEGNVFSDQLSKWVPGHSIQPSDIRTIRALYKPEVKPGMNEQELYTAIGELFPSEQQKRQVSFASLQGTDTKTKADVKSNTRQAISEAADSPRPSLLFEKTYLHTDRDVYAIGDTLWYKAYLVNGQDNKPTVSSGNLYVELLAPDSAKILNREIIRMENGTGKGDMALDDSLPAGQYRLRAYTNWMRNFGDNFVFEKNITILNTRALPVEPVSSSSKQENTKDKKSATATATQKSATQNPATNTLPLVRFYPEGGSLVNGISTFVGVKAEDGYGKGIPATGAVISAAGDTVSRFTCDSLGIGELSILPLAGKSYHATVELGTRHDQFQLPSALSTGLALQIRQTDTAIHAVVHAAGLSDSTVSMTVKHSGRTILAQRFTLKEAQLAFKISTASLPEGISAITIYDADNKPECERLIYIHQPQNNNKNELSISSNKTVYQPKEQTTITIRSQPNSNLSMAVVDASIVPVQTTDIVSYLNLQSELKGNIESPNRYFDTTNINRKKQLDQLLLTQGWRDFVWRRMADTTIRISYAAENGINVSGRIWEEVRNKMLPNLNISMHADSAKGIKLFSARTDSAGRYHFDGLMIYGNQRIQLSATDDKGADKGSIWLDTIRPLPVRPILQKPAYLQTPLDSIAKVNTEKKVETMKSANIHGITRLNEVTIKEKKTFITRSGVPLTTWGPDQVFNITPNDYQYKTLEWYILQNVKEARKGSVYYQRGAYTMSPNSKYPITPVSGIFFTVAGGWLVPPMLIVNGQELYIGDFTQAEAYRNMYFPMPLNKFKKIMIRHMIGGQGLAEYFLIYLTMQDNYTIDNPGFLITDIPGYYQARTFYEPPPNAKPSIADYRTTIHWQPDIKTDATGKATVSFYNALPQTDVRVVVQGITPNGIPLAQTTMYEVK